MQTKIRKETKRTKVKQIGKLNNTCDYVPTRN